MFVVVEEDVEEEEFSSHSFIVVGRRRRVDHLVAFLLALCVPFFVYQLISQWRVQVQRRLPCSVTCCRISIK